MPGGEVGRGGEVQRWEEEAEGGQGGQVEGREGCGSEEVRYKAGEVRTKRWQKAVYGPSPVPPHLPPAHHEVGGMVAG